MPENSRVPLEERLTAQVNSKIEELARRVDQLERRMDEISRVIEILSSWHKFELEERRGGPAIHAGKRVIGRIPIWGSGRYLLVLKTLNDKFKLDIV